MLMLDTSSCDLNSSEMDRSLLDFQCTQINAASFANSGPFLLSLQNHSSIKVFLKCHILQVFSLVGAPRILLLGSFMHCLLISIEQQKMHGSNVDTGNSMNRKAVRAERQLSWQGTLFTSKGT